MRGGRGRWGGGGGEGGGGDGVGTVLRYADASMEQGPNPSLGDRLDYGSKPRTCGHGPARLVSLYHITLADRRMLIANRT